MSIVELKVGDYERFFEADGASFLFASLYCHVYRDLDCIAVNADGSVSVWLKLALTTGSRLAGLTLINEKPRFEKYVHQFNTFLSQGDNLFQQVLEGRQKIKLSFEIIEEFLSFYRFTEFFYTDAAYRIANDHSDAGFKKRLSTLELLKTDGRSFLNRIFNGSQGYIQRILYSIEKNTKICSSKLSLYSLAEISADPIMKLPDEILDERKGNYILTGLKKEAIVKGNIYREIASQFVNYQGAARLVVGTSASRGITEGLARVLIPNFRNYDELDLLLSSMQPGEVLVTETTSPDLLVACRQAAAIVTNQGGLGSHAAIISRELGIPCIVGTHNATKAIATGDFLRVDADNGVVHIVRRVC